MSLAVEPARCGARITVLLRSVLAPAMLLAGLALLGPVQSARAAGGCTNELFRTGPGANLPDCRAYEQVSPSQKNGGEIDGGPDVESNPAPQQAALNGEAITYGAQTAFPEANPAADTPTVQYLSRRSSEGWHTQAITPEQNLPGGAFDPQVGSEELSLFQGFNEDLSHGFLAAYEPSLAAGAPAGFFNPYLRDDEDGSYRLLSDVKPPFETPGVAPDAATPGFAVQYAGMSSDGSHVIFTADDALTPGALPGGTEMGGEKTHDLYESYDGRLELVSVLPADEGGEAVQGEFGSPIYGASISGIGESYDHVLSSDGRRAFWTHYLFGGSGIEAAQLYMHELTAAGARTVRISASQQSGGEQLEERLPAHYVGASVDGEKVYFVSCQRLTDDSTAGGRGGSGCGNWGQISDTGSDLYQYDVTDGKLTDLTANQALGQTASVREVLGISEDGSYVYFAAEGALVANAPSGLNFYMWHEGDVKLIASSSLSDYLATDQSNILNVSLSLMSAGVSRVSPSGRFFTFESSEPLTGYDNTPLRKSSCELVTVAEGSGNPTGKCIEVYEYDALLGKLTCVSCNPTGVPPVGNSVVPFPQHLVLHLMGWQSPTVQQRYLLDDGRVFFDSRDELLPQASNSGELNVYEYEPEGVGDCRRASGCLALVSSGTSSSNSLFLDASAGGNDVFFLTRQALVAADGDESMDVYDARVDGGFEAPTPPPCEGEACRAPITPAPAIYQAPPSATFVGPGDPVSSPSGPTTKSKRSVPRKTKHKPRRKSHRHTRKRQKAGAHRSAHRGSNEGGHR